MKCAGRGPAIPGGGGTEKKCGIIRGSCIGRPGSPPCALMVQLCLINPLPMTLIVLNFWFSEMRVERFQLLFQHCSTWMRWRPLKKIIIIKVPLIDPVFCRKGLSEQGWCEGKVGSRDDSIAGSLAAGAGLTGLTLSGSKTPQVVNSLPIHQATVAVDK